MTVTRQLPLGRAIVERRARRRRPEDDGRVRVLQRPERAGDALGPHAAQPARARAHRRHRHLAGGRRCRASTRCSRTPTSRARTGTGSSSATSRCSRTSASATRASRSRSSRPSTPSRRAAPPRRSASSTSRSSSSSTWSARRSSRRSIPTARRWGTATATTRARTSSATSSSATATPTPRATSASSGVYELGIQDQAFLGPESGLAVPDGEGGVDVYVATQWLHVDRDQVAPCLGLAAGAGAHPSRRRRRRVRRPRGPLDADPRRDARAAHRPPGEDRLRPRRVVLGPRPPPPGADLGRAPRDARGAARLGADADPARRRRLRLELDGGHVERGLLRLRAVRRPECADRVDVRLHQQPAVRRHARLRRRADLLRRRGADGQARGGARHRPRRAAPAERARPGRRGSRPDRS